MTYKERKSFQLLPLNRKEVCYSYYESSIGKECQILRVVFGEKCLSTPLVPVKTTRKNKATAMPKPCIFLCYFEIIYLNTTQQACTLINFLIIKIMIHCQAIKMTPAVIHMDMIRDD